MTRWSAQQITHEPGPDFRPPTMVLEASRAAETVCLRCGSVVGEVDLHDEWHRSLGWGK